MLDLGRVFNAPKWKIFAKIRIPNAYPYILSALKITATAAVIGAVVGEFVASQRGLGYVIIATQSSMNTSVAFAALFWISVMGFLVFGLVSMLTRILTPWAENADPQ
jgi:NitT/TauT family transport system permease protein